jgi:hypothetical protein
MSPSTLFSVLDWGTECADVRCDVGIGFVEISSSSSKSRRARRFFRLFHMRLVFDFLSTSLFCSNRSGKILRRLLKDCKGVQVELYPPRSRRSKL